MLRTSSPILRRPVAENAQSKEGQREMRLFREGRLLKVYDVSLGGEPAGHKAQEGDQRTPEGIYHIDFKKSDSAFHLALHISYPGPQDIQSAKEKGVSPAGRL
ncbi:MAG: L,D-transpeptidase family protein [Candidatus Manganitrophus sp.]|nr:MAG: L,D-transpeptidase family protein [Candidatus Manganitrophus sp.]